mgnify:CR=1 FL=1
MDKSIQNPASLRTLGFLFQKQHTQQSQNSGSTLLQNNLLIILKNLHTKKKRELNQFPTSILMISSLKRERGHSGFRSHYHGLALDSTYRLAHIYYRMERKNVVSK